MVSNSKDWWIDIDAIKYTCSERGILSSYTRDEKFNIYREFNHISRN